MDNKQIVYLVGIGMGNVENYTKEAIKIISTSDILIGAERMINSAKKLKKTDIFENKKVFISYKPSEIKDILSKNEFTQAVVLLSGDTGFYSGAKKLESILFEYDVRVVAGISSVAYFCSKIGQSWDNAEIVSCHGKQVNLISRILRNEKTFALLDGKESLNKLCEKLVYYNVDVKLYVGINLSYQDERIITGSPKELINIDTGSLVVVFIVNENSIDRICYSIKDEDFIRDKVPMTKRDVRALSISKLGLKNNSIVYDIGAGSGSVSIETAMQSPDILVYAVEKNELAVELIEKNKRKFVTDNVVVIHGKAPEAIENLPMPDCVFIGGSTGNIRSIIEKVFEKNSKCNVVVNTVTLDTLSEIVNILKAHKEYKAEITQVQASHSFEVGDYMMMRGDNPVYIINICVMT